MQNAGKVRFLTFFKGFSMKYIEKHEKNRTLPIICIQGMLHLKMTLKIRL